MKKNKQPPQSDIVLYTTPEGDIKVEVFFQDETVWLTQKLIAQLFDTTKQNISLHLRNIYKEGELDKQSVVKEFLTTAPDRKKYKTSFTGPLPVKPPPKLFTPKPMPKKLSWA